MQIQNIKAVRTKDNRLYIFYYNSGTIFSKCIQNDLSEVPVRVIDNAEPVFSLRCTDDGIYLLAEVKGGIYLCYYNYIRWAARPIVKSLGAECSKISFFIYGESVHIIYSVRKSSTSESLYLRSMKKENWLSPVKIADITPFYASPYLIGNINPAEIKIYYRISDKAICFSSLSLVSGTLSERENLLAVGMPCADISILTNGNDCYVLYLAKGMFSSQLIYKGITATAQSKARVIWEGQLPASCSLIHCDGKLYALIYNDSKAYVMYSDGNSFSSAKNLGIKASSSYVKAEYINYFTGGNLTADEVIIDSSAYTFPIVSDIDPTFVPSCVEGSPAAQPVRSANGDSSLRAAEYEDHMSAMNSQIGELSMALAKRNEDIASVSARWRSRYESLARENEELKLRLREAQNQTPPSDSKTEPVIPTGDV